MEILRLIISFLIGMCFVAYLGYSFPVRLMEKGVVIKKVIDKEIMECEVSFQSRYSDSETVIIIPCKSNIKVGDTLKINK